MKTLNEQFARMQRLAGLITESEYKNIKELEEVSITGDFNDMDFPGIAKKEAMAYLKTPEGIKAVEIFKKLVSQPFDSVKLTTAIKAAKFQKMNHFRAAAAKAGLELDNLGMDNAGTGDFAVENSNYEDQGAAIAFLNNKFFRVG